MHLRALLLCEDVRLEVDGTLTLIGMYNDRIPVRSDGEPIVLEHLTVLLVVGGLHGAERVGFRRQFRRAGEVGELPALRYETHNPHADEHNIVFAHVPMIFPAFGNYEIAVDVEANGAIETFMHRFSVFPSPLGPEQG